MGDPHWCALSSFLHKADDTCVKYALEHGDSEYRPQADPPVADAPSVAAALALRAAILHVERTFDSADGEALADALTVAVVDAGWRPAVAS